MKTIFKRYFYLTLGFSFFLCTSCKPIKYFINKKYPPLSVKDQQLQAINKNIQIIDSLKPSIGVWLNTDLITPFLQNEIKEMVQNTQDPNVIVHSFIPKVRLDKQSIIIDAEFDISLKKIQTRLTGELQGYGSVTSVQDSIIILPALKTMKIRKVDLFKREWISFKNRVIADLIKPATKHWLDNLNRKFITKTPSIYVGWEKVIEIDPEELFSRKGVDLKVNSPTISVARYVKQAAVFIDTQGMAISLELSSNDTVPRASQRPIVNSKTNPHEIFRLYRKKYNDKWISNFVGVTDSTQLSVSISKKVVANIFNDIFNDASLEIYKELHLPLRTTNDKFEIGKSKIHCSKFKKKFKFTSFKYSKSCKYSCKRKIRWKFPKLKTSYEDPFCVAARNSCKIARETARSAWKITREKARILNQIENEAIIQTCKLAKLGKGNVSIGRLKTSISGSGSGKLTLRNIKMNEDLTYMSFETNGDINMRTNAYLKIKPHDLGHIMCLRSYDKGITTNFNGRIFEPFSGIRFTTRKEGNNTIISGKPSLISYKLTVDKSPITELLGDSRFIKKCPVLYPILFAAGSTAAYATGLGLITDPVSQLLFKGETVGKYDIPAFEQTIKPIQFKVRDVSYISPVSWGQNSLDFVFY